jgi:hypothetical protein
MLATGNTLAFVDRLYYELRGRLEFAVGVDLSRCGLAQGDQPRNRRRAHIVAAARNGLGPYKMVYGKSLRIHDCKPIPAFSKPVLIVCARLQPVGYAIILLPTMRLFFDLVRKHE